MSYIYKGTTIKYNVGVDGYFEDVQNKDIVGCTLHIEPRGCHINLAGMYPHTYFALFRVFSRFRTDKCTVIQLSQDQNDENQVSLLFWPLLSL